MDHENQPKQTKNPPSAGSEGELAQDSAVDDFFRRLNYDLHHPKPGQEAMAAALEAVQRLALQVDTHESAGGVAESMETRTCASCGSQNPRENRFCARCGVPIEDPAPEKLELPATPATANLEAHAPGQHHYHHHYHHHYFSYSEGGAPLAAGDQRSASSGPVGRDAARVRSPLGGASLSRAEAAIRKLIQDWALACNTKHLDDLVSLYGPDAIVLRSNVPPVRGAAAIREFFFGVLDAGLGEVEMEPLRTEVFGDIAFEAGRCQMLVPVAMTKRREERGKYLTLLGRQSGDWKIFADCWSSDLSLGVSAEPGPAKSATPPQPNPILRPPRRNA